MRILLLLILCFAVIFVNSRKLRKYTINLDENPTQRWNHVIRDHLDYLPGVIAESKNYIPTFLQPFVWFVSSKIAYFFPKDKRLELEGIALESGIPLGEVVGLNILYDIAAFDRRHVFGLGCTSIVAQNSKGQIIHGRNLDFDMTDLLKNITIYVDFTRNGEIIYSGITFVLYNGLLTGQRPNEYSVSLNARYSGPFIDNIVMEIYTKFKRPVSYFIREVLETKDSFEEAVDALSKTHLFSPSYIIVAGTKPNEGVIISRNRWNAADIYRLEFEKKRWFLVETNFDHWKGDRDERRLTAIAQLKRIGASNISASRMFDVLSTHPVNNNLTVFSTVISAARPALMFDSATVRD
ncbi:unnamed protein product [Caenorhabditis bovis]|uniref:N-acylethanolamine-hydrolyzing acid amidase n=1 Tax=Caenorhabditis bovis TaxID=2654633 RepID=A0A8S1EN11_9PELO|nr:unnamed protein product [Caenorhabditis bovis]